LLDVVLLTTSVDSKAGAPTYHPANSDELVNVAGWRTFRVDVAH
jgi:hypothetical protein